MNCAYSQILSNHLITDEVGGACFLYGGGKNCVVGFGRRFGMPRPGCSFNIKTHLHVIGFEYVEWINLAQVGTHGRLLRIQH